PVGRRLMIAFPKPPNPLPGDPVSKRLCEIFGAYLWQSIQAPMPDDATQKPQWQTNTRYPLKPRVLWSLWQDANTLVGVRFGRTTSYALLDLDKGSCYCTPNAIAQLRGALETIGITRTLLLRSSWSGGLHLYIPLPEAVKTFNLAVALQECLKTQGFQLKSGQLEIFPNAKSFGVEIFTEYNAHRLPLQPGSGSCLLNDSLEPVTDDLERFLWVWEGAAQAQDMALLEEALETGRNLRRKRPKRQSLDKVEAWRSDLETEIEEGWTGPGQTNPLLKSIACYGRVFEKLEGEALVNYIIRIAVNSPGYEQHCQHQSEIGRRARDWARAVEKYYWPLGSEPLRPREEEGGPNGNEERSQEALARIRKAVEHLVSLDQLPATVRGRVKVLVEQAKTSAQTLYKHKYLWHPEQVETESPVTVQQASDTANSPQESTISSEPSEAREMGVLHTLERNMKCGGKIPSEVGSHLHSNTPEGGVRGGQSSFPQAEPVPETPPVPIPPFEIQEGIQQQIRRLGWTASQAIAFIAESFNGQRWSQLSDNDRLLLLYRLRNQACS
ncbi:MAG TPA: hypothetical protein V6D29_14455, partial [Leptolyngbyaceae cyanobacterium]